MIRCVAQTLRRQRCRNPIADQEPTGHWTLMPTDPGPTTPRQHLAAHLVPREMAVYDLTHLPATEQLRWRGQRCPVHGDSRAADVALTEWAVFDPFTHHRHIRTTLPEWGGSATP